MKCDLIIERLEDYIDGLLSEEQTEQYMQHLLECQECQNLKKQIFQIQARYRINVFEPFQVA